MKDFYTPVELLEMLGISEQTIRRLLNKQKLKGYKKHGRWHVFHEDLESYVKGSRIDTKCQLLE